MPHVLVDGSARPDSVLCLSHWPGSPTPRRLRADLSAQSALAYLRRPRHWHLEARAVSNDHFDEDGLASLFALNQPEAALAREEALVAYARAGDFGVLSDDRAARSVLATRALVDPGRGGLGSSTAATNATTSGRYAALLPMVPDLLDSPERYADLYREEEAGLAASRFAFPAQSVLVTELSGADLAVFDLSARVELGGPFPLGHRSSLAIHPMALHSATRRSRILVVCGRRYHYHDRYETWVNYRSRRLPLRRDLQPLAARLSEQETGRVTWSADPPGALVAVLDHDGESSLEPASVEAQLVDHLTASPPAWDPYRPPRPISGRAASR